MSSITRIRTQMVEREFLIKALEDLGYGWREGNVGMGLFETRVDIRVKGAGRVIGFRKAGQTYEMVAGGMGIGRMQFLRKVTQRYAYHAARAKLEEQGFTLVNEEVQQGERIHLVLRRMA